MNIHQEVFYLWEGLMKYYGRVFSSMKGFFLFSDEGFDTICLREQMNATWTTLRLFSPWHFVPIFFVISMEWSLCLRRFWHAQKSHDLCWHYAMQLTPKNRFELIIWNAKNIKVSHFSFPFRGGVHCADVTLVQRPPLKFLEAGRKNMLPTENFGWVLSKQGGGSLIPLLKFGIPRFVCSCCSFMTLPKLPAQRRFRRATARLLWHPCAFWGFWERYMPFSSV